MLRIQGEVVNPNGKRGTVPPKWDLSVPHVIASQDENRACKRTLKVLMVILEGRWILSIDWIQACIEAKAYVGEEYEISLGAHGMKDVPRLWLGRLTVLNKKPKLFEGREIYFTEYFVPSYSGTFRTWQLLQEEPSSKGNPCQESRIGRASPGQPHRRHSLYTAKRSPKIVKLLPKEQTSSTEGCRNQKLLPVQRLQRSPPIHGSLIPLPPTSSCLLTTSF
ncbi:hypothetical protein MLD38_016673 [Melastoma candidum]|nr:hypothetical protein MLD38_016673 [Melastoma candidum]